MTFKAKTKKITKSKTKRTIAKNNYNIYDKRYERLVELDRK